MQVPMQFAFHNALRIEKRQCHLHWLVMHSACMEKHERLKAAREAAGFTSATAAARSLSVAAPTYLGHENGSRDFDDAAAELYARRLGVRTAWLTFGEEPRKRRAIDLDDEPRRLPVGAEFEPDPDPDAPATMGEHTGRNGIPVDGIAQLDVTAGMGGGGMTIVSQGVAGRSGMTFAAENIRDYWRLPVEILTALGLRAGDIAIMPVQGDSMSPTLTEGEYVFVDTRHRLPSPDGLYALTDDFGGIVVKRLEVVGRRDDDTLLRVISDNPKHEPKQRLLSEMAIIGRIVRRFGVVT